MTASDALVIHTAPTRYVRMRRVGNTWVLWLHPSVEGQSTYYILYDTGVVEFVTEKPDNTMTVRVVSENNNNG